MLKTLLNRILASPTPAPADTAAPPPPSVARAVPDDIAAADALIAEGNACEDAGQLDRAEALYRDAIAKAPGHARTHLNLGIVLAARDDGDGAAAAYERVLAIAPHHPHGNYNLARLAFMRGELARAETLLQVALQAQPEFPQALVVQSRVLDALGRTGPAIDALDRALKLQPDNSGIWLNQAQLLVKARRIDDAEIAVRQALRFGPPDPDVLALLSQVLCDHGFAQAAREPLRAAIAGEPGATLHRSNELLLLNMLDDVPRAEAFRLHVAEGQRLEAAIPERFGRLLRDRDLDPQRRLRIGYVSGDFLVHPVTTFLLPVLERHDRARVEVFCYSSGATQDHVTDWVRARCDRWVDARGLSDAQLADAIHADGIDVLVDLSGHTKDARLGVFCQRPAPVQVSWLGYLNTTGLTRIDYRLCDARTDPLALSQPFHTERLVHLPHSQWCYRPFLPTPVNPVAPLERHGHVTFGSFNSALKITSPTVRRWGAVMARLPGSRLRVADIRSERKRSAIRDDLAREGIAADRVEFVPRVEVDQYLELFSTVDLSLDTFPYGGGTTTLDSLWMGVPVVAALGATPVSRSAASILQALGLDDWVAPSVDAFVDVAVARASDSAALVALRHSLRERMQASPLTDEVRFVHALEDAYRQMWIAALAADAEAAKPAA